MEGKRIGDIGENSPGIFVKFCGGCNPLVDRTTLVGRIERILPADCRLVTAGKEDGFALGILVCGCPSACADRSETRRMAHHWIAITGPAVDAEPVAENFLAEFVAGKILSCFVSIDKRTHPIRK